jgi:hypothetical protein
MMARALCDVTSSLPWRDGWMCVARVALGWAENPDTLPAPSMSEAEKLAVYEEALRSIMVNGNPMAVFHADKALRAAGAKPRRYSCC